MGYNTSHIKITNIPQTVINILLNLRAGIKSRNSLSYVSPPLLIKTHLQY